MNLAACDLALAILDLVFSLPALFASDWIFGDVLAVAYAFAYFLLVSVSMVMLAIIAVDRYHVIFSPQAPCADLRAKISIRHRCCLHLHAGHRVPRYCTRPRASRWKMYISGCYIDFTPTSKLRKWFVRSRRRLDSLRRTSGDHGVLLLEDFQGFYEIVGMVRERPETVEQSSWAAVQARRSHAWGPRAHTRYAKHSRKDASCNWHARNFVHLDLGLRLWSSL